MFETPEKSEGLAPNHSYHSQAMCPACPPYCLFRAFSMKKIAKLEVFVFCLFYFISAFSIFSRVVTISRWEVTR